MPSILRRLSLALIFAGFAASFSWAQVAKPPDPTMTAPDTAKPASVPVEKTAPADKEVIELSPFVVDESNNKGYQGLNVMSGSRLNTKLEDVAASISIVTKKQLMDFAATDINDVFAMEVGVEGTRTYTANFNDGKADVDSVSLNPNSANRIRGLGAANQAMGNFATSNAIPIDVYNVDAIEISRGANSSIFGVGEGTGTVNLIPAAANLTRSSTGVQTTLSSYGTKRATIDINRPILKDVVALRYLGLAEDQGFTRDPSSDKTHRMTLALTVKPLKNTTIRVSYENFSENYSRPNSSTATDYMSLWAKAGKPSYDPTTNQYTVDGKPVYNAATNTWTYTAPDGVISPSETGVVTTNTGGTTAFPSDVWLAGIGSARSRSMMWIDQGQSREFTPSLWYVPTVFNSAGRPTTWVAHEIALFQLPANFQVPARFQGGLAYNGVPASTDKSFYDYTKINLAALNSGIKQAEYSRAEIEQLFLHTSRQTLALQLGMFKERIRDVSMAFVGNGGDGVALTLQPDIMTKYPDGTTNPYYGAPYFGALSPQIYSRPQDNLNYRANLVYEFDLSKEKNFFLRFLGRQRLLGYKEYRDSRYAPQSLRYMYRITQALNGALAPSKVSGTTADTDPAFLASPLGTGNGGYQNFTTRYFVGDGVGGNVDYASSAADFSQNLAFRRWGSTVATRGQNQWITESLPVGSTYYTLGTQEVQTRTKGWVYQAFMFDDRIIPTYGERIDKQRTRNNIASPANNLDSENRPISTDYLMNYTDMPWLVSNNVTGATDNIGTTRTKGIVVKPLPWISLRYNQSNSFKPDAFAIDLHGNPLPNPYGTTKDYGIGISLNNKLSVRLTRYETLTIGARQSSLATAANRITTLDFDNSATGSSLGPDVEDWLTDEYAKVDGFASSTATGTTAAQQQVWLDKAHALMGITQAYIDQMRAYTRSVTSDAQSKGYELEINYNPNNYWTMKFTGGKMEAITSNIAGDWQWYRDWRLPVWQTIKSPFDGSLWWNTILSGTQTSQQYYVSTVEAPMKLNLALQGKPVPQNRKYSFNFMTNYRLAGITSNKYLKNLNVGGRISWQDKAAIGFMEGAADADGIVRQYDANKPIYDSSHTFVDLFAGYDFRLWQDKIRARVQLNVRNAFEGGRLQAFAANPDGTLTRFRIIDPREYVLSMSFDL